MYHYGTCTCAFENIKWQPHIHGSTVAYKLINAKDSSNLLWLAIIVCIDRRKCSIFKQQVYMPKYKVLKLVEIQRPSRQGAECQSGHVRQLKKKEFSYNLVLNILFGKWRVYKGFGRDTTMLFLIWLVSFFLFCLKFNQNSR